MSNCIFNDIAECSGTSSEHIIQSGLGGRHETQHVLCDSCNHFFGEDIDPGLCAYYSIIIDVLRPLMPSELQTIARHVSSVGEDVPLVRKQGGVVTLKKIYKTYKPDGSIQAIYSPNNLDLSQIQAIARAHGMKETAEFSMVPLSELTPSEMTRHRVRFGPFEHRAAAKTILDVTDWVAHKSSVLSPARAPQLRGARGYVRHGTYFEHHAWHNSPMYNLEDELREIFGGSQERFSNRVLFCNSQRANRCYAFLQIAQTMPLGICLGESIENKDYSLLYEADLLTGGRRRFECIDNALISYQQYKDNSFILRTKESMEFAFTQMRLSFERQLGRATFLVDLRDDKNISETIRQQLLKAIVYQGLSGLDALRSTCETLLYLRFKRYEISDFRWAEILRAECSTDLDFSILESNIKSTGSMGNQEQFVISHYRNLVRNMVMEYGYPKILVQLPDT